jgi:universal stress protein E
MQTIKKILVDIDPDKQQPITIKLLSCLYYPYVVASNLLTPKQLEKTQAEILKKQQGKLDSLITQYSQSNVTFETEVMWHSPIYQGILKVVGNFKPDLVIKLLISIK